MYGNIWTDWDDWGFKMFFKHNMLLDTADHGLDSG